MSVLKKAIIVVGVCGVLIALLVARVSAPLQSNARRAWKERAIDTISNRVADPTWANREIASLKQKSTNNLRDSEGWISESMILMHNGDWLACTNICRKENIRIYDLFIGRGSDGRWYYSTYHFCIGKVVLRMEEQSESLDAFAKTYFLRPFAGHSDESLQKTWHPNSQ